MSKLLISLVFLFTLSGCGLIMKGDDYRVVQMEDGTYTVQYIRKADLPFFAIYRNVSSHRLFAYTDFSTNSFKSLENACKAMQQLKDYDEEMRKANTVKEVMNCKIERRME